MWFPSSSTLGGGPQSLVVALTFFSFPLFFQSAVLALPEIRSDLQLKSSDFKLNPAITLLNPPPPSDPLLLLPIKDLLPPDNLFKITDAVKTKGISLAIKIPVDLFVTPRLSFKDRSQTVLQQSLPQILQQFNVPADQIQARVDQGIPLLINGIQELLSDDPSAHSPLVRRNILDTIGGWAKDAGCALVAAGGLPLFLLAAADFTASNTDASSTSPEQDFFLYPVWGNLAHDGPVKIFYQATRAPFFKGTSGTTFNRNIFTRLTPVQSFSESNHRDFEILVQTLIHEFTHVDQYRRKGYDITSFGYDYLFQWCSNGGYDKITLEVDAYATQHKVDSLLFFDVDHQQGNEFFQVWRTRNLGPQLGNPIAQTYTSLSPSLRELAFQRGTLQIQNGPCFRTFTPDEIIARETAKCSPTAKCFAKRNPRPLMNTKGPKDGDPGPTGPRVSCTNAEKIAQAQACQDSKNKWNAISNRAWTCNLGLPVPPPPPPPPKPGCPASCSIERPVPITSHSCQFDDPPIGCNRDDLEASNAECKAQQKYCNSP